MACRSAPSGELTIHTNAHVWQAWTRDAVEEDLAGVLKDVIDDLYDEDFTALDTYLTFSLLVFLADKHFSGFKSIPDGAKFDDIVGGLGIVCQRVMCQKETYPGSRKTVICDSIGFAR